MKNLGAYVGDTVYSGVVSKVEKNTFVWYEIARRLTAKIGEDVYDVSIWSLKGGYPNERKPDAIIQNHSKRFIDDIIVPVKDVADKYCIEWENNGPWKIKEWMGYYDYRYDYERITAIKIDEFGSNNSCHWEWEGERAFSIIKNAKVNPVHMMPNPLYDISYLTTPYTVADTIKEELKKSLEKSALNSCYGIGGFTTNPDPFKVVKIAEKETKTMEKKTMTETDTFLKHINGITITSTYSKLDHGCGRPYYIYYPKMDINEEMADTLLTVLLMAKRDFMHKVVFNPEKGTTTVSKSFGDSVTVRCKDAKFDYILGYNMARIKMYLGSDDYNWFNKIKNHRKTHIEYTEKPTEPKTKRTSKKGGKK